MIKRLQGMALVFVLWLITLLTASISTIVIVSRVDALQSNALRSSAQAEEIARAAIEYALWRLQSANLLGQSQQRRWYPDNRVYYWTFTGVKVAIRIQDETGKVDLNMADQTVLASLIRTVSPNEDADNAPKIAGAIVDWRDSDNLTSAAGGAEEAAYRAAGLPYRPQSAPFETVSQLRLVLGVSPRLYQRLKPYVTVYSGSSQPDSQYAPATVLTAMGLDARTILAQRQDMMVNMVGRGFGSGTYTIEAKVLIAPQRQTVLTMTVRVGASRLPESTYTVLHWEQGARQQ